MSPKRPKTLSEVAPYLSCFFSEWQTKQNLRDYGETSVRIVLDWYSIRNDLEQIYCKNHEIRQFTHLQSLNNRFRLVAFDLLM